MLSQSISFPRSKKVELTRSVWVKGVGLPKDGICIGGPGVVVTVRTDNGADWYIQGWYRGRKLKIATIPSSF